MVQVDVTLAFGAIGHAQLSRTGQWGCPRCPGQRCPGARRTGQDGSGLAEEGHLLTGALDEWVQAQQRLQRVEVRSLIGQKRAQVVRFQEVPAALVQRLAEERRAL